MSSHTHFHVAVHAFFFRDNQVLLSQRANTGYMDGFYSVPAGHVDAGETLWHAMQREVQEEVGCTFPQESGPAHVMRRIKAGDERIDFFFVFQSWEGEPTNLEPEKCSQVAWFPLNQLPENVVPYVREALRQVQEHAVFSDYWER